MHAEQNAVHRAQFNELLNYRKWNLVGRPERCAEKRMRIYGNKSAGLFGCAHHVRVEGREKKIDHDLSADLRRIDGPRFGCRCSAQPISNRSNLTNQSRSNECWLSTPRHMRAIRNCADACHKVDPYGLRRVFFPDSSMHPFDAFQAGTHSYLLNSHFPPRWLPINLFRRTYDD